MGHTDIVQYIWWYIGTFSGLSGHFETHDTTFQWFLKILSKFEKKVFWQKVIFLPFLMSKYTLMWLYCTELSNGGYERFLKINTWKKVRSKSQKIYFSPKIFLGNKCWPMLTKQTKHDTQSILITFQDATKLFDRILVGWYAKRSIFGPKIAIFEKHEFFPCLH